MLEFFAGVFTGVANGMLGDRLRKLFERNAHSSEPAPETEIEILRDIRAQLSTNDPLSSKGGRTDTTIYETWVLNKPPLWYTIWKRGRKDLTLSSSANVNVTFNGPAGQFDILLTAGVPKTFYWPDGTWIALASGEAVETAQIQVRLHGGD